MFLFGSFLFTGCKKTVDVIKKELPENISKQELLLWINNYQKLMPGGPKPILEQTLKTYYKGQMILKMPLSSGGGYLYFTKTDHLEVQFIRIVSADDQINTPFNGYYEFINMNTYEYKKVIFKQGVRQAEVNNSLPKQQTIKNTSTIKSTETWVAAFLRCLVTHIIAIPRRNILGEWQCYGLGGSDDEVSNLAPPENGSGGLWGDGPVISIGGGAGPSIDWLNWFISINMPGYIPSYPDGGGNVGDGGSGSPNLSGGEFPYELIPDPNFIGDFVDDPNVFEDDPMHITFDIEQNPWPTINNVLSPSQFVKFDYRNCLDLAIDQIKKVGLRDLGYGSAFKIYDKNGGPYPNIAKSGINYIITKLQSGKPVIVGIDNKPGTISPVNDDGKTDHFVTIVGTGQDSNGSYLIFYDNATNIESKGTSLLNKLYFDSANGIIRGKSVVPYANAYADYTVTQIRKNQ